MLGDGQILPKITVSRCQPAVFSDELLDLHVLRGELVGHYLVRGQHFKGWEAAARRAGGRWVWVRVDRCRAQVERVAEVGRRNSAFAFTAFTISSDNSIRMFLRNHKLDKLRILYHLIIVAADLLTHCDKRNPFLNCLTQQKFAKSYNSHRQKREIRMKMGQRWKNENRKLPFYDSDDLRKSVISLKLKFEIGVSSLDAVGDGGHACGRGGDGKIAVVGVQVGAGEVRVLM
ncbi:ATP-dependent protease ATPase subunit HslU [Striga asiatica]|uniref:ATP-dependent protease ATPase subunit HslU n=1 Tax=Striga asiatica TaxID=4170 RepID=A0A5A7PSD2_STRAF|nr:ATP-dependent protease ATPase subunit HslU [Striga asiatica]